MGCRENVFKEKNMKNRYIFFAGLLITVFIALFTGSCASSPETPASEGTYIFVPRLRARQGGMDIDVYLDRVEIQDGFLNVYLVDTPVGKGSNYNTNRNWGDNTRLHDVGSSEYYSVNNTGEDSVTDGIFITFMLAQSFSKAFGNQLRIISQGVSPQKVLDEITLGEPDIPARSKNTPAASSEGGKRVSKGTYTFVPRLRASQGGREIDLYLDRVEVTTGFLLGDTFIVYLVDTPVGRGDSYRTERTWGGRGGKLLHVNASPENTKDDRVTGGIGITFTGYISSPFTIVSSEYSGARIEGVTLDAPDPIGPKF
jgi:hypothetical protein